MKILKYYYSFMHNIPRFVLSELVTREVSVLSVTVKIIYIFYFNSKIYSEPLILMIKIFSLGYVG